MNFLKTHGILQKNSSPEEKIEQFERRIFFFKFYCAGVLKENTTPAVSEINYFKDDAETWSSYDFIIGTATQYYLKFIF